MILLLGVHGALPAILAQTLKLDGAVNLGEQGVVLTDAHIDTGMDVGASLANQNVARFNNNTVMAHIARLREKLHEPSRKPKFIKTVWGVGYTIA